MAESTKIAWTRSTLNPWIGCTKVSPGCDHCYAETEDARGRWDRGAKHWGPGVPRYRTSAETWHAPLTWNRHAAWEREHGKILPGWERKWSRPGFWPVFCASLADVFDNEVPWEWRRDLFRLISRTPALTWLLLTKRIGNAERMIEQAVIESAPHERDHFWPWPHVWLGASIVNQEEADRDIPKLLATPAAKRFVSYEPALDAVDFRPWLYPRCPCGQKAPCDLHTDLPRPALSWLICGGESGPKARPFDVAWARSTVEQCKAAGVACFVKQDSGPRSGMQGRIPDELWLKEFPDA